MRRLLLTIAFSFVAGPTLGQQLIVIPVIADEVLGVNNSIWQTEVQIIKKNSHDNLTVRRVWVCTGDGGFEEDPATATTWDMTQDDHLVRMLTLSGWELLSGTGKDLGAVALEITGGEAIVNARIADIYRGSLDWRTPFGQGQAIPTNRDAILGPSHLPWLGGCRNVPCTSSTIWDFYRVNIGVVNPNPTPLTITGLAIPFGYPSLGLTAELWNFTHGYQTFTITIPPYGWHQFPWRSNLVFGANIWGDPTVPTAGFVMSLLPDSDAPYLAYASTVFAPDPATGVPAFNDPLFISAEPGFIEPFFSD